MLEIAADVYRQMIAHLVAVYPAEGCGFLSGPERLALINYPVTNQLHSPTAFRMDPQEQVKALLAIDDSGLDLVAIYHSHPEQPPAFSADDYRSALDWPLIHLVIALRDLGRGRIVPVAIKGYRLQDGEVHECPVNIV